MSVLPKALARCVDFCSDPLDTKTAFSAVRIHQLASHFLRRVGLPWLASIVSDRAICLGNYLEHPLLAAAGSWHMGHALIVLGLPRQSREHVSAASKRLDSARVKHPQRELLQGALQLVQAQAAAADGDLPAARKLTAQASASAFASRRDCAIWGIRFGVYSIQQVHIEIALQCGDFEEVSRLAMRLDVPCRYPIADQAAYHLQLAYAFARRNDDVAAVFSLARAADLSTEELRYNHHAREALEHLVRRDNRLIRDEVVRLAKVLTK